MKLMMKIYDQATIISYPINKLNGVKYYAIRIDRNPRPKGVESNPNHGYLFRELLAAIGLLKGTVLENDINSKGKLEIINYYSFY